MFKINISVLFLNLTGHFRQFGVGMEAQQVGISNWPSIVNFCKK
jgi:hypothetical protein